MTEYETLVESVNKMEGLTPEQKDAILAPAKALNTEAGKRGSDLINVKKELDEANSKVGNYKDFTEQLAKMGLSLEQAKKMAAEAGLQSTQEDTLNELKNIIKEKDIKLTEANGKLSFIELENKLTPAFDEAVANFTNEKGEKITLMPHFSKGIKEELFKGIKIDDDEVVIKDRIGKALTQAKLNQDTFETENGVIQQNGSTHTVDEKLFAGSGANTATPNMESIKQAMNQGGNNTNSAAQAIAMAKQAAEANNQ